MKEKIIFVFPGQGAQYVGMAQDLFRDFAAARYAFEQVSDIAKKDIAKICFNGSRQELAMPENTSLGTFAHSISVARIIEAEFGMPLYNLGYAIAGHSMGQYSALHCADSIRFADAVNILSARSSYMSQSSKTAGGMACVIGLDKSQLKEILFDVRELGYAAISNHNASNQFIVSGEDLALKKIVALAKEKGAIISKRLNISVPAHCELMRDAATLLRNHIDAINIESPKTNWFSNQTANVMNHPVDVKTALVDQMTNGVRWYEIMEKFPEYKITRAYELGPGRALTGLINRTNVNCVANYTDKSENVYAMLEYLRKEMVK